MRVAGWLDIKTFGRPYFLPHFDKDPISYSYIDKSPTNLVKSAKVKADIAVAIKDGHLRSDVMLASIGTGNEEASLDA